jgi:malate permease and related proteins
MGGVVEQVLVLVLMMAAGFISAKAGIITKEGRGTLTNIVLYVSSPMLVISSFQMQYSADLLKNMGIVAAFAALSMGAFYLLGAAAFRPLGDGGKARVLRQAALFSNCGYMGFPMLLGLFGETGVVYGSVYMMVFIIFLWTLGVYIFAGKTGSWKQIFLQPGLIAVAVGVVLFLGSWRLPSWADKAVSGLGALNTPLAMMLVGSLVAEGDFKAIFKDWALLLAAGVRLVLLPALSLGALWLLWMLGTGLPGAGSVVIQSCVLLTAMPVAANVAIFASMYDVKPHFAAQTVLVSTLLSVATVPGWIFILQLFIGK